MKRCFGESEIYAKYHDEEWAKPVYDDEKLFEMLILEGAQAGLSWEIVLKKREAYRKCFHHFKPEKVAKMSDEELDALCQEKAIIRHRLKIYSARKNALVFLAIQKEFSSFSNYLWPDGKKAIDNAPVSFSQVPTKSPLSDKISKDLKKRGMSFVGSTIIYAYLQAVGVVNDHLADCPFR